LTMGLVAFLICYDLLDGPDAAASLKERDEAVLNPNGGVERARDSSGGGSTDKSAMHRKFSQTDRQTDPLLAICMVGAARTLPKPRVYRTIKRNCIDTLSRNSVLFTHLKLWDDETKHQEIFGGYSPIENTDRSIQKALRHLQSVEIDLDRTRRNDTNPNCILTSEQARKTRQPDTFVGRNRPRFVGHMKATHKCYRAVEDYEKRHNLSFDAVVKIRPDVVWFFPAPSAEELLLRGLVTHFMDLFIFSPRKYASSGFSDFWESYSKCNGLWEGAYWPENAFKVGFGKAGARMQNDRNLPIAIARANRSEPGALNICGWQLRVSRERCIELTYRDVSAEPEL